VLQKGAAPQNASENASQLTIEMSLPVYSFPDMRAYCVLSNGTAIETAFGGISFKHTHTHARSVKTEKNYWFETHSCSASHLWQSWRYSGRRTEEKEAQRLRNSHNLRRLDWGVVERTRAWQLLAHAHNVRASLCCPVKLYRFPQTRYRVLAVR
jgi:hypothetical protein